MTISINAAPIVLIEEEKTQVTFTINSSEPIPAGGLVLTIDSGVENALGQFDLLATQLDNIQLVSLNDDVSGFTIRLTGETGTIILPVADDSDVDSPQNLTFSLEPGEGYTVDENAGSVTVTIEDAEAETTPTPTPNPTPTPDSNLPVVSLITGPDFLVESEGTVSAHVFNVTGGTIPEGGLVVSVNAPNLSQFDLEQIEIIDGEIIEVREDGFDIKLTDFTTLINLPVLEDNLAESGINTASFTLEIGDGYEINSEFNSGEFSLFDTPQNIPPNLGELNDTIALASKTGLSADNPQITISGSLDFEIGNRYQNEDGSFTYIDGTEDVDFYQVDLNKGDIVAFDIDAVIKDNPSITEFVRDRTQGNPILRLFDAEGNELAVRGLGQGPGELFATSTDPYLEFQAPADGSYYLGVSVFTNGIPYRFGGGQFGDTQGYIDRTYDPSIPGSGDGDSRGGLDYRGIGEYDLQITLNPENPVLIAPQQDRSNNTPPTTIDAPAPGEPTVSLSFVAGTYDTEDNLVDGNLVEGLPNQGSILTLVVETEGEIPEEGTLVTVNSNGYLRDYVTVRTLVSPPFSPGAELVDVVSDDTGRETGIQLRIFEPITFFPLNARTQLRGELLELETDGPEEVTFFLEGGEGYGVSATNNQITSTFYDSVEQAGEPSVIPEVSVSISENQLIESAGTATTLQFNLSEPPPEDGVLVYIKSDTEFVLSQFDIFNVEISGGTFPFFNGDFSGFYFKITEQVAEIDLSAFPDPFVEGLQDYRFTIQESAGYTINSDAAEINFSIADNPDSVVEVSLSSEPEFLVESEGTSSIHTFTLSTTPPESGITVEVDAPNLNEFNLEAISVTGGEISDFTETGFSLNITETTSTIDLPVLSDNEIESLETATFTLIENNTEYLINPEANQATFTLVDTPNLIPSPTQEGDTNDTIPQATTLNLNPKNTTAIINGDLAPREPNSNRTDYRDFSEDVDLYSFEVKSNSEVIIDIDTVEYDIPRYEGTPQRLDSELRLFDAEGNELARVNSGAAPDEELSRDPYLKYSFDTPGTYYIGISQLGNRNYDPFTARSGSGWLFPQVGVYAGEYQLNVELIPGEVEPPPESEAIFNFEWTGQIAEFSVTGQFSYDENLSYTDGIVREEDLLDFDISFFDPEGNLLKTYEDNHLTFPEFNFAYDINKSEILQDGYFLGADGFNFGEKTLVGENEFTGLSFWSRPEFNSRGEVPPPHLHIDDWSDEFGFPLGFSSHEDVAFFTIATQELLDTGRLGETYINQIQDNLNELGQKIVVTPASETLVPIFGSLEADTIEIKGKNQLIFAGDSDDLIDASVSSKGGNRIYAGSSDDTVILGMSDRVIGGAGDDKFFATSGGDNVITGGEGTDQFWIATVEIPDTANTITDFTIGEDVLAIAGLGIGFEDLSIIQQDKDTLIAANGSDLAILQGFGADSLVADNFVFV